MDVIFKQTGGCIVVITAKNLTNDQNSSLARRISKSTSLSLSSQRRLHGYLSRAIELERQLACRYVGKSVTS